MVARLRGASEIRERHDPQLGRRPAQEGADQEQLVHVRRSDRRLRTRGRSETRLGLDTACGPCEEGSRGGDAPARDEERALKAVFNRRHEQAELEGAKPLQLSERACDLSQRSDPVTQPRGVLEAEIAGETLQLRAQRRQRVGGLALPPVERPSGETRSPAALEWPVRAGRVR